MQTELRGCVALVAARLLGMNRQLTAFEHIEGQRVMLSGLVTPQLITLHDHTRGTYLCGLPMSFYDHGSRQHLALHTQGGEFDGFDYKSGWRYRGFIEGSQLVFYDEEDEWHYTYQLGL